MKTPLASCCQAKKKLENLTETGTPQMRNTLERSLYMQRMVM